ncbi:MAG: DUF1648 domain-containing protein [Luteibaculaceae bacterium]
MGDRPRITLNLSIADKVAEGFGWILLCTIWILTVLNYQALPEIIPIHYNAAGVPDGFGKKATILMLPLVATGLFLGLTVLNKYPHVFNYPIEITQENALKQYTSATRLLRYLKIILLLIFGGILLETIGYAHGKADGLGTWFLPLTLGLIFIPIVYVVFKAVSGKQHTQKKENQHVK